MAVTPVISSVPATISPAADVTRANLPLSNILTPGEVLSVSVVEKLSANQYRVSLKNVSLAATSDIPLNIGEKIQVKVHSVLPQIVLSMSQAQKQSGSLKISEGLIQWRMNPDALTQLFGKAAEFIGLLQSASLPSGISAREKDALIKLFDNLIFSSQTKNNPLFVKEFASRLGLFMESELSKKAAQTVREGASSLNMDNLKASLLKLSAQLSEALRGNLKMDAQTEAKLLNLASFVSEAVKSIEARQAVNFVYQQSESGLYLQIPLAAGETMRHADIFIAPENKHATGAKKYSSCVVRIFLDLDYLGEISIDAALREGRVRCVIKCEDERIRQLIDEAAGELKKALSQIGYGVEKIDCLQSAALAQKRSETIERQLLESIDLVNQYV